MLYFVKHKKFTCQQRNCSRPTHDNKQKQLNSHCDKFNGQILILIKPTELVYRCIIFSDNGVPGLTNLQIAVITACVSIVIIIVIGASLLYCCISEKRSRELRLKTVGRVGHSSGNNKYYRPKFQYTGDRNSMSAWSAASKNFDQTRNSSLENHASLNLHEHYAKRPYMLPSVVQQPRNAWTSTLQTPFVSPYEQSNTAASNFSSNFYAYNAARPSNRSKNGYAKYQKRFKK